MITVSQSILIVAAAVIGSVLLAAMLNHFWPPEKRRTSNDLIGWQATILGTTYAVILGFMLYTVWTSYGEAGLNVNREASAVVNVYRLADGIPEPQRTQLKALVRSYADAVVYGDWPEMAKREEPRESTGLITEMWKAVMSVTPASPAEVTAQERALSELSSLSEHRLTRLLQNTMRLPVVLWCVLLVGGVLAIVEASTFGAESVKLQILQTFSFSLLVSLSLVAIALIHRPFQGPIHISDHAFRLVQQYMRVR